MTGRNRAQERADEIKSRRLAAARVVAICPECAAGKHVNCDGSALNEKTDEITSCVCGDEGHACTCTPEVINPTPSMLARGFADWRHHGSRCAITVARQQPITPTTGGES